MRTGIDEVLKNVKDLRVKIIPVAARMAINRTMAGQRTMASTLIRKKLALKASNVKARMNLRKASGNKLDRLRSTLTTSNKPISLLEFVVGQREPVNQEFTPVANRKKLRARVRPGLTKAHKGKFIQRGKGGSMLVFMRKGSQPTVNKHGKKKKGVLTAQRVPGPGWVLERNKDAMSREREARFLKEFRRSYYYLVKRRGKV